MASVLSGNNPIVSVAATDTEADAREWSRIVTGLGPINQQVA